MRFEITRTIHYGYFRTPGIYDDLTDAEIANLAAPRPGLPHGYGRVIHDAPMAPIASVAAASTETTNETAPTTGPTTEPPSGGEGSNDPTTLTTDPKPGACPECGKDFADKSSPALSLAAHARSTGHSLTRQEQR